MGLPPDRIDDVRTIYEESIDALDLMRSAGVKIAFGTDLLAGFYTQQCREFELRRDVFTPVEILRQATSVGAEILMQAGKLGCIEPGAHADLIVVDGDPLADIGLLAADGRQFGSDHARRRSRQEPAELADRKTGEVARHGPPQGANASCPGMPSLGVKGRLVIEEIS